MLYGLIAEDGYIEKSIPILIAQLVNLQGHAVECRRMNGKPDFVANFWRAVKEFQFSYPGMHKVLAVCDADRESSAVLTAELQAKAAARLGPLPFPLIFHVIIKELETWWIAESAAISAAIGVNIPFPGGNVEQSIDDPKAYIIERVAGRSLYTQRDAAAAAGIIDLPTLRARCPGFVVFEQAAQNGHRALRS